MILIDSCILLDIFTKDPVWFHKSSSALSAHAKKGLAINPIIYGECSVGYATKNEFEGVLVGIPIKRLQLPYEVSFIAAKAFLEYRKRGGEKRTTLPDFFIGAHAVFEGISLLTRDAGRFKTYFKSLNVLQP